MAIFGAVFEPTSKGKVKDSLKKPEEKLEKRTGDPPACAYCIKARGQ